MTNIFKKMLTTVHYQKKSTIFVCQLLYRISQNATQTTIVF